MIGVFECLAGECSAIVGDDNFFEQAPEGLSAAVDGSCHAEAAAAEELRQQVPCSFDRSGDKLGKEGDEGEPGDEIACGLQLSSVDVDGGTDGLEGIEADAYGQNQIESSGGWAEAGECECIVE